MRQNRIEDEYFDWIIGLSSSFLQPYGDYRLLSEYLYSREFYSDHGNDADRGEDGLGMRIRFAYDCGYDPSFVEKSLPYPCSMLEMMLALAIRCEEHIMGDPGEEDDSGRWFRVMIESMHLDGMSDDSFDEEYAAERVDIVLDRRYSRNGDGSMFRLRNSMRDSRKADIWYQMCWYLAEITDL